MNHEQPQQPDPEREQETAPGIWVGSLADYNDGVLHGAWIDPARENTDVHVDIQAMLARSPSAEATGHPVEEWGIFDYEGFGPLRVGEYESIDYVAAIARGIAEHGSSYAAWASIADSDQLDDYDEYFIAHVGSVEAYVQDMVDDLGYEELLDRAVPPSIRPYVRIDIAGLARDMQLGGDITPVPDGAGGYWLFHNH